MMFSNSFFMKSEKKVITKTIRTNGNDCLANKRLYMQRKENFQSNLEV